MRLPPDYIQFYPTLRCNRSCGFCFNSRVPSLPDMALGDYRRMIEALAGAGVQALDIMGGEPTLHPDILPMVRLAEEAGLSVNISSNGSRPDVLAAIIRAASETTVGISIHKRAEFDQLRDFLAACRPVVKSVYGETDDPGLQGDILSLRPRQYYLLYRDALEPDELRRAIPFDRFVRNLQGFGDSGRVGSVFCSGFLPEVERYPELLRARCPAGTTKLGVLPDGSVYPCNLFFGRSEFLLGNILSGSLDQIWRHGALSFFRSFTGNTCPRSECSLHHACHGGCPAHGFMLAGSLAAPDPRCMAGHRFTAKKKKKA